MWLNIPKPIGIQRRCTWTTLRSYATLMDNHFTEERWNCGMAANDLSSSQKIDSAYARHRDWSCEGLELPSNIPRFLQCYFMLFHALDKIKNHELEISSVLFVILKTTLSFSSPSIGHTWLSSVSAWKQLECREIDSIHEEVTLGQGEDCLSQWFFSEDKLQTFRLQT